MLAGRAVESLTISLEMKENDKEDNIFNEEDEEEYKNDNNIKESNANQKLSTPEKDNN